MVVLLEDAAVVGVYVVINPEAVERVLVIEDVCAL